jgi:hypothetical protein
MPKKHHIDEARAENCNWADIARPLQCTSRHLGNWRQKTGFNARDPYVYATQELSDEELDALLKAYLAEHPERGERTTIGYLRSQNLHISRLRIRQSINRIDSAGRPPGKAGKPHSSYKAERYVLEK